METIPKADCEKIGFLRKTHGVNGGVVLEYEEQFEYSIEDAQRFFIELEGLLVPFFIEDNGLRLKSSKSAIVKFDYVETEKYAKRLVGCSAYLYNDEIIDEPEEEGVNQLVGFIVYDEKLGEIGPIEHVDDYSGNVVITVSYRGDELLIPFNEDFIQELSQQERVLKLNLPDGLIDG